MGVLKRKLKNLDVSQTKVKKDKMRTWSGFALVSFISLVLHFSSTSPVETLSLEYIPSNEDYYKHLPPDLEGIDFNDLLKMEDALVYPNRPWKVDADYYFYPQPQKKGNNRLRGR